MLGFYKMRCFVVGVFLLLGSTASAQTANSGTSSDSAKPDEPPPKVEKKAKDTGFAFGSYGRINAGTDLRGSTPEQVSVVRRGSRVVQNNYTELDLYYRMRNQRGVKIRTVTTLAVTDPLFHYTGDLESRIGVRNFYAMATWNNGFMGWIGSRLYRGDDIYLLDFWPLDDVNTIGAGGRYLKDKINIELHGGLNRLTDPFQFQTKDVPAPVTGSEEITILDRQRFIATAKGTYRVYGDGVGTSLKVKLYGELHAIGKGSRVREDETVEQLPKDFGWVLGAQLGAWGFAQGRSHANFYLRYGRGLGAFDELELPDGFDLMRKTSGASELLVGASINYEFGRGGVIFGGYSRRFVDADGNMLDPDDGWEYIADIRPHHAITGDIEGAVDLSYQARFPKGLSPTAGIALDPAIFQIAPMLIYTPFGTGTYDRPHFRLIYRAAHLNEGARDQYPLDDRRRRRSWVHYLGVQAEWWFNSTYQ